MFGTHKIPPDELGDFAAIISGDIEQKGELEILNSGMNVSSQVLELGHHGSRTSSSREWLQAVNPKFVFWQAGEDNQYGHPHAETIMILEELNIPYMGTATHGNITINADRDGSFSVNGKSFEETETIFLLGVMMLLLSDE